MAQATDKTLHVAIRTIQTDLGPRSTASTTIQWVIPQIHLQESRRVRSSDGVAVSAARKASCPEKFLGRQKLVYTFRSARRRFRFPTTVEDDRGRNVKYSFESMLDPKGPRGKRRWRRSLFVRIDPKWSNEFAERVRVRSRSVFGSGSYFLTSSWGVGPKDFARDVGRRSIQVAPTGGSENRPFMFEEWGVRTNIQAFKSGNPILARRTSHWGSVWCVKIVTRMRPVVAYLPDGTRDIIWRAAGARNFQAHQGQQKGFSGRKKAACASAVGKGAGCGTTHLRRLATTSTSARRSPTPLRQSSPRIVFLGLLEPGGRCRRRRR